MPKIIKVSLVVIAMLAAIVAWSIPTQYPVSFKIDPFTTAAQPDQITCGPTSARMVLRYYGHDLDLRTVEAETKTQWFDYHGRAFGMTAPDYLSHALRQLGVPSRLRVGSIAQLKYYVSQNKPVIVLVRSGVWTWHYVVVIGYDERRIFIADPAGGIKWDLPEQHFLAAWEFTGDLDGNIMAGVCPVCGGTGHWLSVHLGPLSICDWCNGSGRRIDYLGVLVRGADISPRTMIVPDI